MDAHAAWRVGCVSYLNSTPLIDGLDISASGAGGVRVMVDVPSRLLARLEAREVDLALCPVIDYHRAAAPLKIVPNGGICCCGPTLTVRLFSRVPIANITRLHADTDSHTSAALVRILLKRVHGVMPEMIPLRSGVDATAALGAQPEAVLLIGDKVVTDSPPAVLYPHQLDLGEAWHELTGLPFVFAVWMAHADADLGALPVRLAQQLEHNLGRIDAIARRHAPGHGWPVDLAERYLGRVLQYPIGVEELQAIRVFSQMLDEDGLIDAARSIPDP